MLHLIAGDHASGTIISRQSTGPSLPVPHRKAAQGNQARSHHSQFAHQSLIAILLHCQDHRIDGSYHPGVLLGYSVAAKGRKYFRSLSTTAAHQGIPVCRLCTCFWSLQAIFCTAKSFLAFCLKPMHPPGMSEPPCPQLTPQYLNLCILQSHGSHLGGN